jgi:hypothetical protein
MIFLPRLLSQKAMAISSLNNSWLTCLFFFSSYLFLFLFDYVVILPGLVLVPNVIAPTVPGSRDAVELLESLDLFRPIIESLVYCPLGQWRIWNKLPPKTIFGTLGEVLSIATH